MADEVLEIEVRLINATSSNLKSIKKDLGEFESSAKKSFGASSKGASTFMDTMKGFIGASVILGTVRKAWQMLSQTIDESVNLYKQQVNAEQKLSAALKATQGVVGISSEEMKKFAREMQRSTTFGDETVIAMQSVMATFTKISGETFPIAIKAAADMSAMFGQDLQQSAIQLGTALNDPIAGVGRLRRIGISFTDTQKESIKTFVEQNDLMSAQAVILNELQAEFGGVAEKLAETDVGELEQMKNALSDIKEGIGEDIIPLYIEWAKFQGKILKGLAEIVSSIEMDVGKEIRQEIEASEMPLVDLLNKREQLVANIARLQKNTSKSATEGMNDVVGLEKERLKVVEDMLKAEGLMALTAEEAAAKKLESIKSIFSEQQKRSKDPETAIDPKVMEQAEKVVADARKFVLEQSIAGRMQLLKEETQRRIELVKSAGESTSSIWQMHNIKMASLQKKQVDEELAERDSLVKTTTQQDMDAFLKAQELARGVTEITKEEWDEKNRIQAAAMNIGKSQRLIAFEEEIAMLEKKKEKFPELEAEIIQLIADKRKEVELQTDEEITSERMRNMTMIMGAANQLAGGLINLSRQERMETLTKEKERIQALNVTEKEKERLLKAAEKANREAAKKEKAIAIGMSIVNTAVAITKAWSSAPNPIIGAVLAALVGVAGAVQIATIASQGFQHGGVVGGNNAAGDNVPVNANTGEMFLTKSQQAELFNIAKGGGVTNEASLSLQINIPPGETLDAANTEKIIESTERLGDALLEANRAGSLDDFKEMLRLEVA